MLADTEAEVAGLGEIALLQLILLDLEATLQDLLGLGSTDGDVDGDLFVTTDTEGTDGVAGLACAKGKEIPISGRLFKNFPFLLPLEKNRIRCPYCRPESARSAAQAPWQHE